MRYKCIKARTNFPNFFRKNEKFVFTILGTDCVTLGCNEYHKS